MLWSKIHIKINLLELLKPPPCFQIKALYYHKSFFKRHFAIEVQHCLTHCIFKITLFRIKHLTQLAVTPNEIVVFQ